MKCATSTPTKVDRLACVKEQRTKNHLVVDDAETNRNILKAYLQGKGVVVDVCATGMEALVKVEEKGIDYYDVVWSDLNMPDVGGEELSKALRSKDYKKYIVILTGNISAEGRTACANVGVDLVCLKPMRKRDLYDLPIMQLY